MLFSSFSFLFIFLPVVLILYFIIKNRTYRNFVLLITSLLFYAWGEPKYIILMIFSIVFNYFIAIFMDKSINRKKAFLIVGIAVNLFLIVVFKYLDFSILSLNNLFNINIPLLNIVLPIGISFYTFQILSYIIDVYRKRVKVQNNILFLGTYISLFPQLIAGPIVRYETIEKEITNRKETFDNFVLGLKRFMLGFGKKVIIANQMAIIADEVFNFNNLNSISTTGLWVGALAYTFQIYYDFSGYSDMAIGLGKMFGFNFLENFNYPYIATTITDFWRRWHISLSSWFKDYVYIPLGGNKVSKTKWLRNIIIVWFLTGLWHGASWNFVIWGLYFALFLILEKTIFKKIIEKIPIFIKWILTFVIVIISWIIFRVESVPNIVLVIKNMFINHPGDSSFIIIENFNIIISLPYMFFAFIGVFPFVKLIANKFVSKNWFFEGIGYVIILLIYIVSIFLLLSNSYNPFIYFRF